MIAYQREIERESEGEREDMGVHTDTGSKNVHCNSNIVGGRKKKRVRVACGRTLETLRHESLACLRQREREGHNN